MLGAGLGTRLRPLTDLVPKPLFPIFGKPVITFAMDHLIAYGVERFVINAHHLPQQFLDLFGSGFYRGREVQVVVEPALLETGGGIKNAADLLGEEPFFVYSGDILTDIDLDSLVRTHFSGDCGATLALRRTGLSTDISFKEEKGLIADVRQKLGIRPIRSTRLRHSSSQPRRSLPLRARSLPTRSATSAGRRCRASSTATPTGCC